MTDYITRNGIRIARELIDFVDNHALSGTGIDTTAFWKGFAALLAEMNSQNRTLPGTLTMPSINLRLKIITFPEQ